MKSLVIVESPTKVKTLKGFLGADFKIMGSQGHVRDLPAKGLSVDIKNDFEPTYELLPDRKHIIAELKKAASDVDMVYLASDPDREGEAIAWHIREALHLKKVRRIEFNEITKTAVQKALQNPRDINMDRVNAQQARRVLDRIIGYELSPLLARKVAKGTSAGRVQSVALRLVCEREREIQAFVIEEYWSITALLSPQLQNFPFPAKLITRAGKKLEIGNEESATELVDALRPLPFVVSNVKKQEKRRHAAAPFITSTLQQEASKKLYFGAKRTMQVAQGLYEGKEIGRDAPVGLITYMRTDSTSIAKEAQESAREFIVNRYGSEFVPETPPQYKNRKSAQEAHEAIRPTYVDIVPEDVERFLAPEDFKLYRLIWRRFVASQMKPAIMDVTTVDIAAGEFGLRASGSIIKFQGFLSVYEEAKDEDKSDEIEADDENADRRLPALEKDQPLDLKEIVPRQHFTQPPPRYTEATLVKALEENGIGRPSTYASILSTIVDRNYTSVDQRRFTPTDLGFLVNDKLVQHFGNIVDVHFTAGIEEKLDDVEEGKRGWTAVLRDFYDPFHAGVVLAGTEMEKVGPEETDLPCLKCATLLQRKRGRFGSFYSCPNEECKATFNIGNEGEVVAKTEKVELHIEGTDPDEKRVCEKCNSKMTIRMSARGPFWGCTGYPKCRNVVAITDSVIVDSNGEKVEYSAKPAAELTDFDCPVCGKKLNKRAGRFGPFLGCSDYPTCKTIVNLDKEGNPRWPAPGEAKQMGAKKSAKPAAKSATKTAAKPATKTAAKTTATAKTTKITAKAVTSQADLDALLSAPTKPVAKMAAPKATAREKTAV
jgi:DNA topoisomerase-1